MRYHKSQALFWEAKEIPRFLPGRVANRINKGSLLYRNIV